MDKLFLRSSHFGRPDKLAPCTHTTVAHANGQNQNDDHGGGDDDDHGGGARDRVTA